MEDGSQIKVWKKRRSETERRSHAAYFVCVESGLSSIQKPYDRLGDCDTFAHPLYMNPSTVPDVGYSVTDFNGRYFVPKNDLIARAIFSEMTR